MVLERLHLTNFRGFESLELTFEPDLTVLVGINGCGKTSILDALLIGLGLKDWSFTDVRIGARSCTVRVDIPPSDHRTRTAHSSDRGLSVEHMAPVSDLVLIYTVNRQVSDATPGTTRPQEWVLEDARMSSGGPSGYEPFFRWFREKEDEENERVRYEGALENPQLVAVRLAVRRLLPGYDNLRVHRRGAMGRNIPRMAVEKDGKLILFEALSEGERTLIAMVADIARRLAIANPNTDDPLAQPCLLVIDELEQHLHPQWQRDLPQRLRELFPGAQMILTTHSPIVVSELLPRHLRALQGFRLLEGAHREGQDVNEILEALFGTPSRRKETQALIDAIREALDEDELDEAVSKLETLEQQLGSDDPEVVRLTTIHRMLGAIDHDAVSEG
jgi:energy-coupling factor transporter ATP-binding protein EcfA2